VGCVSSSSLLVDSSASVGPCRGVGIASPERASMSRLSISTGKSQRWRDMRAAPNLSWMLSLQQPERKWDAPRVSCIGGASTQIDGNHIADCNVGPRGLKG
jgi:hypothetical protein